MSVPAALLALLPATIDSEAAHAPYRLEEVVVTARKREENAQTVPVSILVYGAEELNSRSLQSVRDVGQVTPNFIYGEKTQSGSSAGQLYIRGIGQQDTQSAFNPGVGIYVDGVYIARPTANDLSLLDVERLEVLYGPQGTLFGKNTNAGALNIVTRAPDASASNSGSTLQLTAGSRDRLEAQAGVNVPLVEERAALTVSASRQKQDGYSTRIDGQDQANRDRAGGRARLFVKLADDIGVTLGVDGTTFDEHSSAYRLVAVRTASPIPTLYAANTPFRYDNRWVTDDDFRYDGTGPNRNSGAAWGTSLTLDWQQPWGALKSISAYRKVRVQSEFDPDGSPLTVLDVYNAVRQRQVSQEFQATGSRFGGRLDWVGGLYFFRESVEDDQPAVVAAELFGGAANFDPRLDIVNRNYAAFGQASVRIVERARLTVGGRAGLDRVGFGRQQVGYPTAVVQQPLVSKSDSWSSFLPRASLEFQWRPQVMTYLSAAKGSKTGGFNGRAGTAAEFTSFDPENVWTYEVGLHSDWRDSQLRVNVALFRSVYSDFQILLNRSMTDPATGQPVPFSFVGNLPRATIRGGELSLTAATLARLRLSAGLGVTDGEYQRVIEGAPVSRNDEFVDAPKFTVTGSAEYILPLGASGQLDGRVDYVHKSTIHFDYSNSPLVEQRPYGLLNARLTWRASTSRLALFVFGRNLTNTHYALGGLDDSPGGSLGEVVLQMGAPREWGAGVELRF